MRIVVQEPVFDTGAEVAAFTDGRTDIGAVVTFFGLVRDLADDPLTGFEIDRQMGSRTCGRVYERQDAKYEREQGRDGCETHGNGRVEG